MEDKSEQSEDSSSGSAWNVTTTKMLIQFYKENRILWDKGHKDYGKKQLQKKAIFGGKVVAVESTKKRRRNKEKMAQYSYVSFTLLYRCDVSP